MTKYKCNTPYYQRLHKRRQSQTHADNERELELSKMYKQLYADYTTFANVKIEIFCELLDELGIKDVEKSVRVGEFVYDIRVGNILIQFVDTISNNAQFSLVAEENDIEPYMNLFRFENAEDNGLQCIHIFDWDEFEKVAIQLKPKTKITTDNIVIDKITRSDCHLFLLCNSYIYPGRYKYFTYAYGAYVDDYLVAVLMIRKAWGNNYDWEILGYVEDTEYDYGCFSKLLDTFKAEISPKNIVIYIDKSKYDGHVYMQYGFNPVYDRWPARVWSRGCNKITQNEYSQKSVDKLVTTCFEHEGKYVNMLENGWLPVFDCGTRTYEWRAK